MEIGISTFGDIVADHLPGGARNAVEGVQNILAQVALADQAGLDVFAFGEHHREDFVISAPEVMMAAAAAITRNIKLSSSVTVLSSADPVRTFQNFATVDLISNGRAEMIAGRGSFIESFPLFGYDLDDYDALFTEKLELLLEINKSEKVTWSGKFRAPINNQGVYPRPIQRSIPIWIGVGGTPASAARAGKLGLPMTIAILGSAPAQFLPFVELYREAAQKAGHDIQKLQLAISSQFYAADTQQTAEAEFYPSYELLMNRVGWERGWSPMDKRHFDYLVKDGPLAVGDVQRIVDKIMAQYEIFHNTRFIAQLVTGQMPQTKVLKAIELLGVHIAPVIRKETGSRPV